MGRLHRGIKNRSYKTANCLINNVLLSYYAVLVLSQLIEMLWNSLQGKPLIKWYLSHCWQEFYSQLLLYCWERFGYSGEKYAPSSHFDIIIVSCKAVKIIVIVIKIVVLFYFSSFRMRLLLLAIQQWLSLVLYCLTCSMLLAAGQWWVPI